MRIHKLSSLHIAALVLISVLTASLLTYTWVGAVTGEITIDENSILLTDGSNPMLGDLDAGTYDVYNSTWSNSTNSYTTNSYTTGDVYYGSDNRTDVLASPMEAWSYLIYVDPANSSLYHAKASNGTVCWTSTNLTLVWENSVGACSDGNSIFIQNGNYTVSSTLTDQSKNNIKLISDGAWLVLDDSVDDNIISLTSVSGWTIEGLRLDGNKGAQSTGYGVYCYNTPFLTVKNVLIQNCVEYGILVGTTTVDSHVVLDVVKALNNKDGICIDNVVGASLLVCEASNNTINGLRLESSTATQVIGGRYNFNTYRGIDIGSTGAYTCDYNKITGAEIKGNQEEGIHLINGGVTASYTEIALCTIRENVKHGIWVIGACDTLIEGNTIKDNDVDNSNTYSGIKVDANADRTRILGNRIEDNDLAEVLIESGNCEFTQILLNDLYGTDHTFIIYNAGTGTKVVNNNGFITANLISGTNSTATTFTIAHGLTGWATHVTCSFNTTAVEGYTWTSDTVNILVTVVGASLPASMTCYADVRYEP